MLDLIPEERIVGEPIVIREWNADEFHRRVLGSAVISHGVRVIKSRPK